MIPDLDLLRTGLATLTAAASEIPAEQLPGLVADLARAQAALLTAACHPSTVVQREPERPAEDRMLDAGEAAAMIGVTPKWLYRHARTLPFTRPISRRIVRFSRGGIVRWLAGRRT